MAQVKHPKFEGMTREVDDTEPWLAAGWVAVPEPAPVEPPTTVTDQEALDAPSAGVVTPDA